MAKKRGVQKGAQRHAEGQHGEKAHRRFIEQLQEGQTKEARDPAKEPEPRHRQDGEHRLFEQRQQHDEAEKNSEWNRLSRDIDRHGHERENFQTVGGADAARALPPSNIDPARPDAPNPEDRATPPVDLSKKRGR